MIRYELDRTCDYCSMSRHEIGDYVEYEDVEHAVKALIEHLWSASPSIDKRDKAKLESEIRAFFE